MGNDCIAARKVLAVMGSLGFAIDYALRINLNEAIVAMTKSTVAENHTNYDSHECANPKGFNLTTDREEGEFDWDEITQGHVLGSFYYGCLVTQIPGGYLADRFGGKHPFGLGILLTSVLSIVTPVAARCSVYLLMVVRALEGLGGGFIYPCMLSMWGEWAPVSERSTLTSFTYAGAILGACITFPITGLLCDIDLLGGWPSVFYIFGVVGCIWSVGWIYLIHDTPAQHPRISKEEREYIEISAGNTKVLTTPWRPILTSPAVLCVAVCQFSAQWSFYTLLTCLPMYLKGVHKFDIRSNGFLSALPYLCLFMVTNLVGYLADTLTSRGCLSTAWTRKLINSIGLMVQAVLLIACGYVGCDSTAAVVLLTIAIGCYGFTYAGFFVNHLDYAPRFAGILMGLTSWVGTFPGFLGPILVGYLTNNNQTIAQWRKVFYINGAFILFGCIVFNIFAEGEELPWARLPERSDGPENEKKAVNGESIGLTHGSHRSQYQRLNDGVNSNHVESAYVYHK